MFTPFNKNKQRRQIAAYLQMLQDTAKFLTIKNNTKMANAIANNSEKTVNGFSFSNKFNKTTFDVDTTDFTFVKLAELYNAKDTNAVYKLDGFWVNRSQLGEQPVLICAELGKLVNAPMHYTDLFKSIREDAAAVDAIKNGKVGFLVYEYESHARKCYGIKFVDIQ